MKKYISSVLILAGSFFFSQTYYQCFDADEHPNIKINVQYEKDVAVSVRYKGQRKSLMLVRAGQKLENEGAHPTVYTTYIEKKEGKTLGTYLMIHSGIWDYIEYTRKDGKKFNFTINHALSLNGDSFRTTSCY